MALKTIDDIRALNQPDPSPEAIGARAVHIASKMSDLPHAYRNILPTTDDPKTLEQAEAAIRSIHAADREAVAAQAAPPPTEQDLSKLSPTQLIEMGLRQEKPGGMQQPPPLPSYHGRSGLRDSAAPLSPTQLIERGLRDGT